MEGWAGATRPMSNCPSRLVIRNQKGHAVPVKSCLIHETGAVVDGLTSSLRRALSQSIPRGIMKQAEGEAARSGHDLTMGAFSSI